MGQLAGEGGTGPSGYLLLVVVVVLRVVAVVVVVVVVVVLVVSRVLIFLHLCCILPGVLQGFRRCHVRWAHSVDRGGRHARVR